MTGLISSVSTSASVMIGMLFIDSLAHDSLNCFPGSSLKYVIGQSIIQYNPVNRNDSTYREEI